MLGTGTGFLRKHITYMGFQYLVETFQRNICIFWPKFLRRKLRMQSGGLNFSETSTFQMSTYTGQFFCQNLSELFEFQLKFVKHFLLCQS